MNNFSDSESILGYMWGYRKKIFKGIFISVMRAVVIAPFPYLFQVIIDHCVPSADILGVSQIGVIFLGLCMLHYVLSVRGAEYVAASISDMILDLRGRIFFKIQYLSFGYLDQQKTGRLLSKYLFDTQKIEQALFGFMSNVLPAVGYGTTVLLMMVFLNWQLSVILLGLLPIYVFSKFYFFNKIQRTNNEARLANEKLTGTASEYFTAIRLVRSLGEEKQAQEKLDEKSFEVAQVRISQVSIGSMFGTFTYISSQVLMLVVIGGGALLVINGSMTVGELFAFVAGLPIVLQPIQVFMQFSDQYFMGQESFRSVRELIDSQYVEEWKGQSTLPNMKGEIRFINVSFAYPSTGKQVIHDLGLHIKPGEKIAFVGKSGSGKSTIVNLILGLYRPDQGVIMVDGLPQEQLNMRWFRRNTALVMQENVLLSGTIADNIRFANLQASDEQVREAAKAANCEEFILAMAEGYHTIVGERGAMLSGGQRQRIAIARAILRNPKILILDEPTSALDYESEKLIQEALDRVSQGRTVITIAHRLSTIRNSDRIIVLREGRILEEGTFDGLARKDGYFKELLESQGLEPEDEDQVASHPPKRSAA